jgi:hypothetical protein
MKERRVNSKPAEHREPFIPCNSEDVRGKCIGGMWIYTAPAFDQFGQPMYGGVAQNWARECRCMTNWRARNARERQVDTKAMAAGER